jgi:hypothetical protein
VAVANLFVEFSAKGNLPVAGAWFFGESLQTHQRCLSGCNDQYVNVDQEPSEVTSMISAFGKSP